MKNTEKMKYEIVALENELKNKKKELKSFNKAQSLALSSKKVSLVNELLTNDMLKSGTIVIISYRNREVEGIVVGRNSVLKDNLTIDSADFDGKKNEDGYCRRYIKKECFVRFA